MSRSGNKKPVGFSTHIIAGGIAGACEAVSSVDRLFRLDVGLHSSVQLTCQPLDTIKVRMQLSKSGRAPGVRLHIILSLSPIESLMRCDIDQVAGLHCDWRPHRQA